MSAIRVRGIRKAFGDLEVLRGVDLDVNPAEVVCIVGRRGRASRLSCAASTCSSPPMRERSISETWS